MLAVAVICGEDDDDATRLAAPARLAMVRNRTGRRAPIASVDEALAYRYTPDEEAIAEEFRFGAVVGGPEQVVGRLEALAREVGADELMLSTIVPDRDDRVRSYERVARAAGLSR
jgi:alkanesulfonate monooxygenase SsuD/methylene tetrahydromethanopterin reductase-like flavin-dependent oxidoreductase (luciferase family)